MLNAACETVRKALRADLTPAERRGLVNDRFLILKRKHRLSGKEHMMLSGWLENYPALAMAYEIKEAGYRIYDAKTRDEADAAFEEWRASIPQGGPRTFPAKSDAKQVIVIAHKYAIPHA